MRAIKAWTCSAGALVLALAAHAETAKPIARCHVYETGGNWFQLIPAADGSRNVRLQYDGDDASHDADYVEAPESTPTRRVFNSKASAAGFPASIVSFFAPAAPAEGPGWTITNGTLSQGSLPLDLVCVLDPIF